MKKSRERAADDDSRRTSADDDPGGRKVEETNSVAVAESLRSWQQLSKIRLSDQFFRSAGLATVIAALVTLLFIYRPFFLGISNLRVLALQMVTLGLATIAMTVSHRIRQF